MEVTSLTQMLELQKSLLDYYVKIEGLPSYPVDLNLKASQKLIKDFIYRVTEEAGESYEKFIAITSKLLVNEVATQILPDYYEELADAWHFWLEIFIFSGIEEDDFRDYMDLQHGESVLEQLLLQAKRTLQDEGFIIKPATCFHSAVHLHGYTRMLLTSPEVLLNLGILHWEITYHLVLAGNGLKNKAWVQSEKQSNLIQYQEHLSEAFKAWIKIMSYLGLTETDILNDYKAKNEINQERIRTGY